MAVSKRPRAIEKQDQKQVDEVINQGSPPPSKAAKKTTDEKAEKPEKPRRIKNEKEIQFIMTIPEDLTEVIEKARGKTKSSRRSWFLMAALEKLKRDGDLI